MRRIDFVELDALLCNSSLCEFHYSNDKDFHYDMVLVDHHCSTLILVSKERNTRTPAIKEISIDRSVDDSIIHITLYFRTYYNECFTIKFSKINDA